MAERAWRLFIAIPLAEEPRTRLDAQLAPYRRRHDSARWLPVSGWHLTLLFLGSVEPGRVPELEMLIADVAAAHGQFQVGVAGGGGRVTHGEGVAWLRVGPGAAELIAMVDRLAAMCPPDMTLTSAPRRTPSAHLTVARRAGQALVDDLRDERLGPVRAGWAITALALLRSHLGPGGSRYETLHEAALYAAAK